MSMKKFRYFLLLTSYFLLLINCKNNNHVTENKIEFDKSPKIEFLTQNYYAKFYVINNYKDNEDCIKYIFDFAENNSNRLQILTDKNIFKFEDGTAFLEDNAKQRFSFSRNGDNFRNKYIKVNFLENIPVHFTIKETGNQTDLTADFETLTVNAVQNFLDYAEKDEAKKENETYTYILLNKNNKEKMKLIYHDYGEWFEVEIK